MLSKIKIEIPGEVAHLTSLNPVQVVSTEDAAAPIMAPRACSMVVLAQPMMAPQQINVTEGQQCQLPPGSRSYRLSIVRRMDYFKDVTAIVQQLAMQALSL